MTRHPPTYTIASSPHYSSAPRSSCRSIDWDFRRCGTAAAGGLGTPALSTSWSVEPLLRRLRAAPAIAAIR
eukprot:4148149-Prymnesium_polylepis.1